MFAEQSAAGEKAKMAVRPASSSRPARRDRETAKPEDIPAPAVRRLSLYLRHLEALLWSERKTISSKPLGDALNRTDGQVRKDLASFGQFGNPGVGYSVQMLVPRLRRILGTDRVWNVLLIGMGNL